MEKITLSPEAFDEFVERLNEEPRNLPKLSALLKLSE
jgi:uncharacterized protein (DUF1778 family)